MLLAMWAYAVVACKEEEKQTAMCGGFFKRGHFVKKFNAGVMEWKLLISTC
jgi:hypothetical protein